MSLANFDAPMIQPQNFGTARGSAIVLAFAGIIRAPRSTTSAHYRMIYVGRFAVALAMIDDQSTN